MVLLWIILCLPQSLSKSNDCLEIVQREEFGFWAFSFGQSLDKFWIYMSNLRPCSLSLDRSRTDSVPLRTERGQGLDFSIHWTDLWQAFDRVWTDIGFHIQSLSNQPMGTSTEFFTKINKRFTFRTKFTFSAVAELLMHVDRRCRHHSQINGIEGQVGRREGRGESYLLPLLWARLQSSLSCKCNCN